MPLILAPIGLMGRAQAGKDTAAARLVEAHGFTKVAFADALRVMAVDIDPVVGARIDVAGPGVRHTHLVRLTEALDTFGYEGTKARFPESRRFLQRLGTEGIRRHVGDDFWVRKGIEAADRVAPAVLSDVRYPNEALAIEDAGGLLVRVVRDSAADLGANATHPSETSLDGWIPDAVLPNNGTVADLHAAVDRLVRAIRWDAEFPYIEGDLL